jgi:hypothetical protein
MKKTGISESSNLNLLIKSTNTVLNKKHIILEAKHNKITIFLPENNNKYQ